MNLIKSMLVVAGLALAAGAQGQGCPQKSVRFIVPFLVWAALRFGTRGQSAAVILLAGISIWDTMHGRGPFSAAFIASCLCCMFY